MIDFRVEKVENLSPKGIGINGSTLPTNGVKRSVLSTRQGQITLPVKAVNRNDLNAKDSVPSINSISDVSSVFVYEEYFDYDGLNGFLNSNDQNSRLLERAQSAFDKMQYTNLSVFQPSITEGTTKKLYRNSERAKEFLNRMIDVQNFLECEIISLPVIVPLDASPGRSLKLLDFILEGANLGNKQLIPIVDMDYKNNRTFTNIVEKLSSLSNNLVPIVMLKHKKFKKRPVNFLSLRSYANDPNLAFFYSSIDSRGYDDFFSETHSSEFLWGDLFSYRFRQGGDSKKAPKPKTRDFEFYMRSLQVKSIYSILGDKESLEDPFNSIYSKRLTELINDNKIGSIEHATLSAYSRLHEHSLSNDELKKSNEFLKTSTARDYIEAKPKLKEHIKRLNNEATSGHF